MSILNVEHLSHGFGDRAIFSDVSFRLLKGEHIGLVGANGEGKSTFMSIVTGKLLPDEGKVEWAKNVHAGYLDQHAVLKSGMTIREALKSAFDPLLQKEQRMNEICDMLGTADDEQMTELMEELGTIQDELTLHDFYTIDAKVEEVARALGLLDLGLDRDVTDLSGGQRTKVLLAKLLLEKPDILLLDEPLGALDYKMRKEMQFELKEMHKKLGITFIYVTHDQIEAMTMASRIVCMKDGRIQQVGTPKEIYSHPHNVFVGGFIGTPPMNFIEGTASENGIFTTSKENVKIEIPQGKLQLLKDKNFIGKKIFLGIRPENIHDERDPIMFETYPNAVVDCKVKISELLGAETNIYTEVGGCGLIASVQSRSDLTFDSDVKLVFDMRIRSTDTRMNTLMLSILQSLGSTVNIFLHRTSKGTNRRPSHGFRNLHNRIEITWT